MNILVMKFSPVSCYLICLGSRYSSHRPFFKHHQLMFVDVRNQVLHPYKNTGKFVVLCILIFKFQAAGEKTQVLNWMVIRITQIQSAVNFLLIYILICYCYSQVQHFTTFSKDPLSV
jgi:hypothetical protein